MIPKFRIISILDPEKLNWSHLKTEKKIDPILDVAIPVCWPCQRGLYDVLAMAIHMKNIFKKHHFVFLYVSPSLRGSGDHKRNLWLKRVPPLPLPPLPPPKKRIKWPHTWTRSLHMDFSMTWNNGKSELVTLHATITQPRELMRKIPHYMSWKAIFNTVVCFGKKICLTHEAVTIVTVFMSP